MFFSLCFAGLNADAISLSISPQHPRILTTQAAIDNLKSRLPLGPAVFPAAGGTIAFDFTAAERNPAVDSVEQPVFGESDFNNARSGIFVRHVGGDTPEIARIQIGMMQQAIGAQKSRYIAYRTIEIPIGVATRIEFSWNSSLKTTSLKVGGANMSMWLDWLSESGSGKVDFSPDQTAFRFPGRATEPISNFILKDGQGNILVNYPGQLDVVLAAAWSDFSRLVDLDVASLNTCPTSATPWTSPRICSTAVGNRNGMVESAQQLGMAYKITQDPVYYAAILNYIDKLRIVPLNAGGDMSMAGRVIALGILYDWLYTELGASAVPNDSTQASYRTAIATTIRNTITAPAVPGGTNLLSEICGQQGMAASSFDCAVKPIFTNWNRHASPPQPSIATAYMAGMNFSSVYGAAVGLLAIAGPQNDDVLPMIETAYSHFNEGFLAVRRNISIDGGYHSGFSYSLSDLPSRLLLWSTSVQNAGEMGQVSQWLPKTIYPYIYGQRGDKTYPASGDNFLTLSSDALVGGIALWAAAHAVDGNAWDYYQQQVHGQRSGRNRQAYVLEQLFWPVDQASLHQPADLDLSRHFRRSGQVLMRDRWTYPDAAVLEFKSTSFITDNHHHLDQNSISLNYKGPLLVDSGRYDSYGSAHWANYYTRSIAHNTVVAFDANERFQRAGSGTSKVDFSNDGGQWVGSARAAYPTLEEIQPGAMNALDGIVNYEYAPGYTYARGNASKAYTSSKLDQANGFLRSVVYLPAPATGSLPIVLTFDSVRTKAAPATFLLHTVNEPAAAVAATALGNGQYRFTYAATDARSITIRNGGGMLIAQTLLPEKAVITKVGGLNAGGQCDQISADSAFGPGTLLPGGPTGDCRFTVRVLQADNSYKWRNYPPRAVTDAYDTSVTVDIGAWRLEVQADGSVPAGGTQYFLHVLHVADNDLGSGSAGTGSARRLVADSHTEAVLIGTQTVVAFNRDATPSARMSWNGPASASTILATGLMPNADFLLTRLATPDGEQLVLAQAAAGSATYRSSAEGVVNIGM
ncbi:heparinase II/III family protein [Janthinobacterium sp. MP5059B]|uniref:heparinase II/III domain-containing protein n=1 Tax=Janthinobacterium sp. MP5059B TaxID=1766683 RepID=UPI00158647D3|nr:heparinase II/III family protein [Janthinobacterium sp. MP5059B]